MKKLLTIGLAAALVMMFSFDASAQMSVNKGLKGGLNFASFSLDPEPEGGSTSSQTGIAGGLFIELDLLGPLDIQVEGLFSQKGSKFKSDAGGESTTKLSYLEVPVLAKISIPLAPTMSYNVHAGPALGFKLSESFDPEINSEADFFKSSDLGAVVGLGLKFNALVSFVTIDARYTLGLSNVSDSDTGEAKNRSLTLLVGLGF